MFQEYPITRCTRKCHVSGRALEPGESYVSALVPEGRQLQRIDVAANQWKKAPEGTVGWWKCKMPQADNTALQPAPVGVLLDTLTALLHNPLQAKLSYLLALILARRRCLVDSDSLELQPTESSSGKVWRVMNPTDGRRWEVPVVLPQNVEEAEVLRQELKTLLFLEE